MKERVKQIRKDSNKTQQQFADVLNVSKSTIEAIEYGRRETTDRIIADICREFNVSETWLRTGSGEMHPPKTREAEIADMVTKLYKENDPFKERLIAGLVNLDADKWTMIRDFVKYLVEIDDK